MDVVEGQCCCHGLMAAAAATVWPSAGVSEGAEAVLRVVRELSEEYQRTLYLNEDAQGGQREVGSQGGTPNTRQACRQAGRQQAVMAGDGWWVGGWVGDSSIQVQQGDELLLLAAHLLIELAQVGAREGGHTGGWLAG